MFYTILYYPCCTRVGCTMFLVWEISQLLKKCARRVPRIPGPAAAPSRRSFLGFAPWREHRNIGNAFLSFRRLTEIPRSSVPCQICYCFAYLLEINSYKTHPEGQGKHASSFLPIYHLKPIQIKGTANTHCFTHFFFTHKVKYNIQMFKKKIIIGRPNNAKRDYRAYRAVTQ